MLDYDAFKMSIKNELKSVPVGDDIHVFNRVPSLFLGK